ncbi:hypothetical protein BESB_006660 [Besnoitia besnoiti]|uniref:ubiquitinyl hydrolase 1 n=1 Tax=Besnoitia besnoiti TaxID=94643 RepID=A0A2A9MK20_BESBE|nr:hypothetical protein BESB_006660 [Besnoitia besnoiti]PFH38325.1 hypothetical protein BESB_006660 [Besnoitia besnoiti]
MSCGEAGGEPAALSGPAYPGGQASQNNGEQNKSPDGDEEVEITKVAETAEASQLKEGTRGAGSSDEGRRNAKATADAESGREAKNLRSTPARSAVSSDGVNGAQSSGEKDPELGKRGSLDALEGEKSGNQEGNGSPHLTAAGRDEHEGEAEKAEKGGEAKPQQFRLRVRCAPFNPVVEIASHATFQDLLAAVAKATQLPYLADTDKFSLLAGFPPKRLEPGADARLSAFLQDGEVLTPERKRASTGEKKLPIFPRQSLLMSNEASVAAATPTRRAEGRSSPRSSNIRTLSPASSSSSSRFSGRREPRSPASAAAGPRGTRGGRRAQAHSLGSTEEEVAENLVRLFTDKGTSAAERGLRKAFSLALHQRYDEVAADERWGAVQGRRFEIREGLPQPGKFTVVFYAPVAGRLDTQRTEEYTALPKPLVLIVLSQVWKSAEQVDRNNLRPYYMAHAQPMVFWNIVRHFDGDFGACFREVFPAFAVEELLERKRELSEKAKENKRQAEEAAAAREEKRLLREQQRLARAAGVKAAVSSPNAVAASPERGKQGLSAGRAEGETLAAEQAAREAAEEEESKEGDGRSVERAALPPVECVTVDDDSASESAAEAQAAAAAGDAREQATAAGQHGAKHEGREEEAKNSNQKESGRERREETELEGKTRSADRAEDGESPSAVCAEKTEESPARAEKANDSEDGRGRVKQEGDATLERCERKGAERPDNAGGANGDRGTERSPACAPKKGKARESDPAVAASEAPLPRATSSESLLADAQESAWIPSSAAAAPSSSPPTSLPAQGEAWGSQDAPAKETKTALDAFRESSVDAQRPALTQAQGGNGGGREEGEKSADAAQEDAAAVEAASEGTPARTEEADAPAGVESENRISSALRTPRKRGLPNDAAATSGRLGTALPRVIVAWAGGEAVADDELDGDYVQESEEEEEDELEGSRRRRKRQKRQNGREIKQAALATGQPRGVEPSDETPSASPAERRGWRGRRGQLTSPSEAEAPASPSQPLPASPASAAAEGEPAKGRQARGGRGARGRGRGAAATSQKRDATQQNEEEKRKEMEQRRRNLAAAAEARASQQAPSSART